MSRWEKVYAEMKVLGNKRSSVQVGVFGGSSEDGKSLVEIAAIHEYGAPRANIPERSFLRFTMASRKQDIKDFIRPLAGKVILGTMTHRQMLEQVGQFLRIAVRRGITARLIRQGLAASTIKRKGHDTALVDTGRLRQAISYRIDP